MEAAVAPLPLPLALAAGAGATCAGLIGFGVMRLAPLPFCVVMVVVRVRVEP